MLSNSLTQPLISHQPHFMPLLVYAIKSVNLCTHYVHNYRLSVPCMGLLQSAQGIFFLLATKLANLKMLLTNTQRTIAIGQLQGGHSACRFPGYESN